MLARWASVGLHALLAGAYLAVSIPAFLCAAAASVLSPLALAVLVLLVLEVAFEHRVNPQVVGVISTGGFIGSLVVLISLIRSIPAALGKVIIGGTPIHTEELSDLVQAVCERVGSGRFASVIVSNELTVATYYTLGGRYLILGRLPLRYLDRDELAAVIAHECAHHHHGAMLANRVHYRNMLLQQAIIRALARSFETTARHGENDSVFFPRIFATAAMLFLPAVFLGLLTYNLFLRIASRLLGHPAYEFYCDSVAGAHFGAHVLGSALTKLRDLAIAEAVLRARQVTLGEPTFDETYRDVLRGFDEEKRRFSYSGSSTHPPLAARLARLGLEADVSAAMPASRTLSLMP
jgi:Zn-dependent protease with chaperone function